jgi:hypothetical protein
MKPKKLGLDDCAAMLSAIMVTRPSMHNTLVTVRDALIELSCERFTSKDQTDHLVSLFHYSNITRMAFKNVLEQIQKALRDNRPDIAMTIIERVLEKPE